MRQAQLLAAIEALMIPTMIPGLVLAAREGSSMAWVIGVTELFLLVSFWLNRNLRYRPAVFITLLLTTLRPFGVLFGHEGMSHNQAIGALIFPSLNIFMCVALVRPRVFLLIGLTPILNLLLLSRSEPRFWPWPLGMLLVYYAVLLVLVYMLSHHRELLEKDRVRDVLSANQMLQSLKDSLEIRVTERTGQLQSSNQRLQEAFETLQRNQSQLLSAEKMASLGRLTAGIAHEINSPLSAVRNVFAELRSLIDEYEASADRPEVTPQDHKEIANEMRSSLSLAVTAADRVTAFVKSIKAQTRDLGAQDSLTFAVQPIIDESLLLLSHDIRKKNVLVEVEKSELPVFLFGLPGRLSQVITNLVNNALDACAGRPGAKVVLSLQCCEQGAELWVKDNGPGIPAENLAHIFAPLFTTKPLGQGTGLGLAIVQDIVTDHFKGEISVVSEPEKGASFRIVFPQPPKEKPLQK